MDPESSDIELIEKYLQGKMDPVEKAAFEDRLDEDHELARKLRLRKVFPSLFNAEGEDLIAQEVNEVPEAPRPGWEGGWSGSRILIWSLIVLAVVGIAGYLVYFMINRAGRMEKQAIHAPVPVPDSSATQVSPPLSGYAVPETTETKVSIKDSVLEDPVVLEIPDDSAIFTRKEEILFRWRLESDTFTNFYIYSVTDGKMMWWKGIRPGIREYRVSATNLRPGLYYWYVGTREIRRVFEVGP